MVAGRPSDQAPLGEVVAEVAAQLGQEPDTVAAAVLPEMATLLRLGFVERTG